MFHRVCTLLLLIAGCAGSVWGQDQYPKWEGFLGYSYRGTTLPSPFVLPGSSWESSSGWALSLTRNLNKNIGVTADFAGQYGRRLSPFSLPPSIPEILPPEQHNFASYQFLFGPQFSQRAGRLTHFAHALFGIYQTAGSVPVTDFAMAFGGGVDVSLTKRWAVRAIEVDFLPEKREFAWQKHVRIETGIVLRLGR